MELLTNVLLDIWDVLSSYCLTALLFSVFFTVVYVLLGYEGKKSFFKQLADTFRKDREFQRFFVLVYFFFLLICKTLLCRIGMGLEPLGSIMNGWLFTGNKYLNPPSQSIENIIMLMPYPVLIYWNYHDEIFHGNFTLKNVAVKSFFITLGMSAFIEVSQTVFALGTLQLSDLFYNTLGGVMSGILYYIALNHFKKRKSRRQP